MKLAVILYNLGGPCCQGQIQQFLFNLFYDPAIINLPNPFRFLLANLISSLRKQKAANIYNQMGGKSPILHNTYQQAIALQNALQPSVDSVQVFTYMRYSYPSINDVMEQVKLYNPNKVILLPLYPQFSTTTSASSEKQWHNFAKKNKFSVPTYYITSYPDDPYFAQSYASLLIEEFNKASKVGSPVVLFSAHGIPFNRIKKGDPYQHEVIKSVNAIIHQSQIPDLEYQICYQSKVGPLKWLEPSIDKVIHAHAKKGRSIVVLPVSFVSEHSETLVELDIQYKEFAMQNGASGYFRVPTPMTDPAYIKCLSNLVLDVLREESHA